MAHNLFSPSSANYWQHCIQSKLLTLKHNFTLLDSAASLQGTDAHEVFLCDVVNMINKHYPKINHFHHPDLPNRRILDDEMQNIVDCAVYQLKSILNALVHQQRSNIKLIELERKYSYYVNDYDVGGTADVVIYHDNNLAIYDLKTGRIYVNPDNNPQLLLYAIAVSNYITKLGCSEPETVTLGVIQPRKRNYKSVTIPFFKVKILVDKIVKKLKDKDLSFYYGSHCKYCPSKSACPIINEGLIMVKKLLTGQKLSEKDDIFLLTNKRAICRLLEELEQTYISRILFGEQVDNLCVTSRELYGKTKRQVENVKVQRGCSDSY